MRKIGKKLLSLLITSACIAAVPLSACKPKEEVETDEYSIVLDYNDEVSRSRTMFVEKGKEMSTPDEPIRVGYQIAGWTTSETGGDTVSFPYTPTGDITLYAQWTAAKYNITFDYNFPGSTPYVTQVEYNGTVEAPAEDDMPDYADHYFYRWEDKAENGNEVAFPLTVKKDAQFYAAWLSNDTQIFDITFNANYSEAPTYDPVQVVEGTTILQRNVPTPTRAGYKLLGWATSNTATEPDITFPYEPTSSTELYAVWERQSYFVRFRYNYEGNPDVETGGIYRNESVYGGDTVDNPGNLSRDGFTFLGWYDSATEGNPFDFETAITSSTNLYAHWQANRMTPKNNIFDAEFTPIDSSESYPGYSGSTRGTGIVTHDDAGDFNAYSDDAYPQLNSDEANSHGHFVIGLYKKDAALTFNIYSETAVSGVRLHAKLAIEAATGGVVFTPEGKYGFKITVNGVSHNYGSIDLVKPDLGLSGMYTSAFFEFDLGTISLNAGLNVIKLITNNDTTQNPADPSSEMGTMAAIAPMVDYIRLETSAALSWHPEYDNLYRKA